MRRPQFCWQLSVFLILAGVTAGAQVPNSGQPRPPPGTSSATSPTSGDTAGTPAAPTTLQPGVTINGKPVHPLPPLPKLPPDETTKCVERGGFESNLMQMALCATQIDWERNVVLGDCLNRNGKLPLPRVIQACTESLKRSILPNDERFLLFESRGDSYLALDEEQRALQDYNEAIKVAPRNPLVYYNRGAFYLTKAEYATALQDFDTALGIDSKFVPALLQRAKIDAIRGNFGAALADYSQAIAVRPKAALLWSDRGHVDLHQHDYEGAVKDEARAIQLDPKLGQAYFIRSVAFEDLGDRGNAISDLRTAVGLDPSLARYVVIRGKTVSLELPPL
ncbi:MAG: tetratricopeptide repeat protein [Steroidobacteraceae bacterium]